MVAISISFAVYALRFITYSIIRDPLWILPVEALNGITFGLFYVTCISYAVKIAPPGKEGTIQGLFFMAYQGFGKLLSSARLVRGVDTKKILKKYIYIFFVTYNNPQVFFIFLFKFKIKIEKMLIGMCTSLSPFNHKIIPYLPFLNFHVFFCVRF